jgi:hypothetical protein
LIGWVTDKLADMRKQNTSGAPPTVAIRAVIHLQTRALTISLHEVLLVENAQKRKAIALINAK